MPSWCGSRRFGNTFHPTQRYPTGHWFRFVPAVSRCGPLWRSSGAPGPRAVAVAFQRWRRAVWPGRRCPSARWLVGLFTVTGDVALIRWQQRKSRRDIAARRAIPLTFQHWRPYICFLLYAGMRAVCGWCHCRLDVLVWWIRKRRLAVFQTTPPGGHGQVGQLPHTLRHLLTTHPLTTWAPLWRLECWRHTLVTPRTGRANVVRIPIPPCPGGRLLVAVTTRVDARIPRRAAHDRPGQ